METIKDPSQRRLLLNKEISNLNRSFATRISGEIAALSWKCRFTRWYDHT